MAKIGDKRAIEILLSNCKRAGYPVVLAIPNAVEDDPLEEMGKKHGVEVYRGEDGSPLHRLSAVARNKGWEYIARVTADDILIDAHLLERQYKYAVSNNLDYCFMKDCPEGIAAEVIKSSVLCRVADSMNGQEVEYVSYYLRDPGITAEEYKPEPDYREHYRLTMDYPEDLTVLRILHNTLAQPFGTLDIINFMRNPKNAYVSYINALPRVTVYVCCYNQGRYVRDCLQSIIQQEGISWELIVVDDGSTDNTPAVLLDWYSGLHDNLRAKVRLVRHPNRGLPASCNVAVKMARGAFVLRVDSDDALMKGALRRMREELRMNHSASAVYAGYFKTDEQLRVTERVDKNDEHHPGCAMLMRGAVHDLKFREGLEHYEGREFFKRFDAKYRHIHLDEPLWFYRQHDESKSHSSDPRREETRRMIDGI